MRQRKEARAVRGCVGGEGAMDAGADEKCDRGRLAGEKERDGKCRKKGEAKEGKKLSGSAVEKRAEWWSMLAAL